MRQYVFIKEGICISFADICWGMSAHLYCVMYNLGKLGKYDFFSRKYQYCTSAYYVILYMNHVNNFLLGAWTPAVQNAYQWLQIDLGKQFIVTAVYVQGRQGSDEYVREFFLEYSDDAQTWRKYTSQLGIPEVRLSESQEGFNKSFIIKALIPEM